MSRVKRHLSSALILPRPQLCLRALARAAARGAVLLSLLLHAAAAAAVDEVKFRVQITAPSDLTSLLEANLDIMRWSIRPDVSEDQLRQLFKTAPQQVRDLLATKVTSRQRWNRRWTGTSRGGS